MPNVPFLYDKIKMLKDDFSNFPPISWTHIVFELRLNVKKFWKQPIFGFRVTFLAGKGSECILTLGMGKGTSPSDILGCGLKSS